MICRATSCSRMRFRNFPRTHAPTVSSDSICAPSTVSPGPPAALSASSRVPMAPMPRTLQDPDRTRSCGERRSTAAGVTGKAFIAGLAAVQPALQALTGSQSAVTFCVREAERNHRDVSSPAWPLSFLLALAMTASFLPCRASSTGSCDVLLIGLVLPGVGGKSLPCCSSEHRISLPGPTVTLSAVRTGKWNEENNAATAPWRLCGNEQRRRGRLLAPTPNPCGKPRLCGDQRSTIKRLASRRE